ncbi:MAG: ABC transporter substrate-binding protein [Betaproteobacteria bacterium]|nr:ABC transporter substrate-binding protein [Betaproteobacteria bacterium]
MYSMQARSFSEKWLAVTMVVILASVAQIADAQPVKIRVGHGAAAEEQLWLMKAKPDVTQQQGKAYALDFFLFPGTDKRFQAYEAGALDVLTGTGHSVILAASEGMNVKVLASISRESKQGFNTQYLALTSSGINSLQQLKGKNIGVNGFKSSIHLWAMLAVKAAGLDPERDVTFVPVPFSAQGAALRSGKIDVGAFPQPFALMESRRGGVKPVFSSRAGVPFDEELALLLVKPEFAARNEPALRAFVADYVAATNYYLTRPREARKALIDAKMIGTSPEIYYEMEDYYRAPDARVDVASLKKMQDMQVEAGFQRKKIEIDALVDMRFLPK